MLYTDENTLGKIEFDEKIVGSIIRRIVDNYNGKVLLSGIKGRIKKNTTKSMYSEDLSFMNIKKVGDEYTIDIYIVLKFGTSIKKTSHELISLIREQTTKITGLPIHKVRLIITGMLSKNFSKRHIEIEG